MSRQYKCVDKHDLLNNLSYDTETIHVPNLFECVFNLCICVQTYQLSMIEDL